MASQSLLFIFRSIGLTVFGVFGSFTYYLPELFPTRLRGTGAGFCYNVGRIIAAGGPFLVGWVASQKGASLSLASAPRPRHPALDRRRAAARPAGPSLGHRDKGPFPIGLTANKSM